MNIRHLRSPWPLVVSSVLVLLALAEATLRLAPGTVPAQLRQIVRAHPRRSTVAHAYIGHLNKPGDRTDPYGFRNDWPWPPTTGIVTLGDSVTLGNGVEAAAAWPSIVARAFPGEGVVNLALGASGPQQYLRVFETFGVTLRAKLILIGFFARNDFWDAAMFDGWLKSGAGGNYLVWRDSGRPAHARLSLEEPPGRLLRSAYWRGRLVATRTYVGNLLFYTPASLRAWNPSETETEVVEFPDGTRLELQPRNFLRSTRLGQPGTDVFLRVFAAVRRIHSLAHENGARAAVLFLPSKEEVYLPLLGESSPNPAAPLRAALEELGITCLDFTEDFRRRAASGEVLFGAEDSQLPNERGHALIAELAILHLRRHAERYGL